MENQLVSLFFGFDGRCPIGVDGGFPLTQVASDAEHLKWAEILVGEGLFFQAQQQIDLLDHVGTDLLRARHNWLRARLNIIQFQNAIEARRRLERINIPSHWLHVTRESIISCLELATQQDPDFGLAWLTQAQICLDPKINLDLDLAYASARKANDLMGESPEVLEVLGQCLQRMDQASEAVATFHRIPQNESDTFHPTRDHKLAELESISQAEPTNISARLQLGRWYSRHDQLERAYKIFLGLTQEYPNRAEGFYGLAFLAYLADPKLLNDVYRLCLDALSRDSNFGLAYELLAGVFYSARVGFFGDKKLNFEVEDELYYYHHAITLDSTCDIALWRLGEISIDKGQLASAIEYLEKAAALDTEIDSVYSILAVIYKGTRQFQKSEWASRKAKELSPLTRLKNEYEQKILVLCGFEF